VWARAVYGMQEVLACIGLAVPRPADRSLVAEDRSPGGVRDQTVWLIRKSTMSRQAAAPGAAQRSRVQAVDACRLRRRAAE
jgi:hypothetical protein